MAHNNGLEQLIWVAKIQEISRMEIQDSKSMDKHNIQDQIQSILIDCTVSLSPFLRWAWYLCDWNSWCKMPKSERLAKSASHIVHCTERSPPTHPPRDAAYNCSASKQNATLSNTKRPAKIQWSKQLGWDAKIQQILKSHCELHINTGCNCKQHINAVLRNKMQLMDIMQLKCSTQMHIHPDSVLGVKLPKWFKLYK